MDCFDILFACAFSFTRLTLSYGSVLCAVAIDGEDVSGMVVSQITALMASKAAAERKLTVLTNHAEESKHEP